MSPDEFFKTLFDRAPRDFEVLLVEKNKKKLLKGERVSPWVKEQLVSKIRRANSSTHDLYFHCGIDLAQERRLRLRKKDADGVCFLWADIDKALTEGEREKLCKDEFAPSVMVCSGTGYHLYWLLDDFYTDKIAAERKNRWLATRFDADMCVDVSRVLRVPGTFNCKKKELLDVRVVFSQNKVYSFDDFGEIEGKYDLDDDMKEIGAIALPNDFLSDARFSKCKWLVDAITTDLDEEEGDHSGRDWRVANKMAELKFSREEIYAVLTHPEWDTGFKGRRSSRYAEMTTNKASASSNKFANIVAMLEEEVEATSKKKLLPVDDLRQLIRGVHEDVLQEGGTWRRTKHCPKYGGLFGEKVAEVICTKGGYRPVYDAEYNQGFIADMQGGVWEVSSGKSSYAKFITKVSGFSSGQQEFGFISAGLLSYVESHGEKVSMGRWVHYDGDRDMYYILADSESGLIMCIDEHGNLSEEWNGVSDVFLRPRIQSGKPLRLDPSVPGKEGITKLEQCFVNFVAGSPETKRFMECFTIALTMCYGTALRTLPIIHLTGPSGAGKSTTLGCMTNFLFGYYQLLLYTTAAAYRVGPSETFMAHDDKENPEKIEEFLLLCSTSAKRTMCDVRNPDDVVIQVAHVVNALTSIDQMKTVAMRRRTFEVEIDANKFPSPKILTEAEASAIVDNRDAMWSGLIPVFAAMIRYFKDGTFRSLGRKVYNAISVPHFRGLSDFVALMVLIEKEVCRIMDREFDEDTTIIDFTTVAGLQNEQEILGRDPLVLCLESFFEKLFNENSREIYYTGDVGDGDVQTITINRGVNNFQWKPTTEEENAEVEAVLGCKVRGIKASATGWVSIFETDTRAFSKTISSPTSLGKQFSRVEENKDFPFYISKGRHRELGRIWNAFQKIE